LTLPWVAVVIAAFGPLRDNSFLWHVRAGTLQAGLGSVLTSDPFSFTRGGEPWRTQSWLVELLYGWAESLSGLGFVSYMLLIVSILTFLGLGLIAYRDSHSLPATAVVLLLGVLALISFLVPRPVLFSYLLMVLVILAWDRSEARWTVPLLFWIWASVHASFAIGLAYVGLTLLMRRRWRLLPQAMVAGLATLATAHGLGVIDFLLDFARTSDALQYLTEWRRPSLFDPAFLPFAAATGIIVVGAFRKRISPSHLWLVVPFLLLGLTSLRAIPPAFLGLAPLTAVSLSGVAFGTRSGLRAGVAAGFVLVILVMPFLIASDAQLPEERFPLEAVAYLDDVPTFHDDRVGGYLIWAEWPERKAYIDDRAELYGERLGEFVMLRRGELEWQPVFLRDGIEQVLLANGEPLIPRIDQTEGWGIVYEDDYFTILRSAP
jgi:hypothetical protein